MYDNNVTQHKQEHVYPKISGAKTYLHVYKIRQQSTNAIPDLGHEVCVTTKRVCAIDLGSATCIGSVMNISNRILPATGLWKLQPNTQTLNITTSTDNNATIISMPSDVATSIASGSDTVTQRTSNANTEPVYKHNESYKIDSYRNPK